MTSGLPSLGAWACIHSRHTWKHTYTTPQIHTCAQTGNTQSDTLSTHVNANSTSGLVQPLSPVGQDGDPLMGLLWEVGWLQHSVFPVTIHGSQLLQLLALRHTSPWVCSPYPVAGRDPHKITQHHQLILPPDLMVPLTDAWDSPGPLCSQTVLWSFPWRHSTFLPGQFNYLQAWSLVEHTHPLTILHLLQTLHHGFISQ